jgi:ChaB
MAAFNSAQKDGLSEEGATKVAWNSVKQGYEQTLMAVGNTNQMPATPTINLLRRVVIKLLFPIKVCLSPHLQEGGVFLYCYYWLGISIYLKIGITDPLNF